MKALILLAPGFEELEAVTIIDLLRRANIEVVLASTADLWVESTRQVAIKADISINQVNSLEFNLVALPGGLPGTTHLKENPKVLQILKEFHAHKKWIAAICAAPLVLNAAELLKDKNFTCYPGCQEEIKAGNYENQTVVKHDNIITSQGPATAISFTLAIIETLLGKNKAQQIAKDLLWQ